MANSVKTYIALIFVSSYFCVVTTSIVKKIPEYFGLVHYTQLPHEDVITEQ